MLTYNWQIEGQQEFEEEPFEALAAKLTRQKNAYKKRYKQSDQRKEHQIH